MSAIISIITLQAREADYYRARLARFRSVSHLTVEILRKSRIRGLPAWPAALVSDSLNSPLWTSGSDAARAARKGEGRGGFFGRRDLKDLRPLADLPASSR